MWLFTTIGFVIVVRENGEQNSAFRPLSFAHFDRPGQHSLATLEQRRDLTCAFRQAVMQELLTEKARMI